MMTNRSRVVLYTGVTNDLARRVWEHQHGEIKGFTADYKLHVLVYHETFGDIRDTLAREKQVKGWVAPEKERAHRNAEPEMERSFTRLIQAMRGIF